MRLVSTGVSPEVFLQPGDIMLYLAHGFVGGWIALKGSDDTSHAELYLGDGVSAASRGPSEGVNTYPVRWDGLGYILRPTVPFNLAKMRAFHDSCCGQGYALWDLVKVFYLRKQGNPNQAQCSEHVARVCKVENGGPGLFQRWFDCDRTQPGTLKTSRVVELFIVKEKEVFCVEADREVAGLVARA